MASAIAVISSMATKGILAEIARDYRGVTGSDVIATAVGGVDVAKRLRAGEKFDVVVLAREALDRLAADGVVGSPIVDIARSPTAIAVKSGAWRPTTCTETTIKNLIERAKTVAVSSGPSGVSVRKLLQTWNLHEVSLNGIVEASPGIPVAQLIAGDMADIGFQQLSELLGQPGIDIIGTVPSALLPTTVFSAAVGAKTNEAAALDFIEFLGSPTTEAAKRSQGMEPNS